MVTEMLGAFWSELNIEGDRHKRVVNMPILETYNLLKPYGENLAVDDLGSFIQPPFPENKEWMT